MAAGLAPLVQRVYVVDGSAAMLEVARKNLSQFDNVEYHQADGLDLPFPEESLDAVFANMYLHHCPDPLAAIREMVRVLRPGGRLVITDMDAHPYAWLKEEMADVWQGFERDADARLVAASRAGQPDCRLHRPIVLRESSEVPERRDNRARGEELASLSPPARAAWPSRRARWRCAIPSMLRVAQSAIAPGAAAVRLLLGAEVQGGCCAAAVRQRQRDSLAAAGLPTKTEDVTFTTGYYRPASLSAAPKEAAEISLGCGNPIAMADLKPGEVVLDIGSGGGLDSFLAAGRVGPRAGDRGGYDPGHARAGARVGAAQRHHQRRIPPGLCRSTAGGRRRRWM